MIFKEKNVAKILKVSIYFLCRVEDIFIRVQKTITTLRILQNEIVGLFYDVKELLAQYRGNLIALVIGLAIPVFNANRNNPGMFFIFFFNNKDYPGTYL